MYDTPAELVRAIGAGEDSYLELKEIVREGKKLSVEGEGKKAAPWIAGQLCCFANSDGGVVVFGVTDQRQIRGLPDEIMDDLQLLVVNAARNNCEPPLDHLVQLDAMVVGADKRLILKVEVRPDFYSVHAPRGERPTVRRGPKCEEVSMEYLPRLLARRSSLGPPDELPILTATPSGLDWELVQSYGERQSFDRKLDERQLENLKILARDEREELHPSVAGLLVFGARPTDHISGAFIDLVVYEGKVPNADKQLDARRFDGTIVAQIEGCVEYLSRSPSLPTAASKDGFGRRDEPAYSLRALQEGIVNALVHRSYQISGSQVRVFVFSDRIEISNPGGLPNSLTVENLFAGAVPFRRNQVLAGFLRDYESPVTGRAYMEARGEGFLTMARECEQLSGRLPALDAREESVILTIYASQRG